MPTPTDRRDFLRWAALLPAAPWLAHGFGSSQESPWLQETPTSRPQPKKKILILGGTKFLGPAIVEEAVRRGHEVTLFNRGRTNPGLFPKLEKLRGDRNGKLDALKGRRFDAVVDTSGNIPRYVKLTAELLSSSGIYIYISSVSVYPDFAEKDTDESSPVGKLDDPTVERITGATYGPLKALCEQAAEKAMPGKVASLRPGLIVGRLDPTDRFTYWPARVARGGRILAPGDPKHGVQYIDVRDLGDWIVTLCEKKTSGTFNALGPMSPTLMQDLLASCKKAAKSDAEFLWMTPEFMKKNSVRSWVDMPVYTDVMEKPARPALCDNRLAIAAGLTFRKLDDTVADTLRFHQSRGPKHRLTWGLAPKREAGLVEAWDKSKAQSEAKKTQR